VSYAESFEKAPTQETLDKVLKNIKAGNRTFQVDFKSNRFNWAYAASIIGFLLMGGLSFYFWKQSDLSRQQLQAINPLNDSIQEMKSRIAQKDAEIEFLNRPSTRKYKLVGIEGKDSINNFIMLYWCQIKNELRVSPGNLPPPPSGMQYQVWAIVDGKPVSVGLLNMGDLQPMSSIHSAEAFGVTLERAGGAEQPNMEELRVFRKV
jgi:hypothetical protein